MPDRFAVPLLDSLDEVSGGRTRTVVWVVAILALWFVALGARHLTPSDEGRYAEISREMFAASDWVTIRYNDLKYFEKPPFHMWMTTLAYEAFGVGDWQARLWVGLSGLIGIVATLLAANRWFGSRVGLFSGLALLAMPTWVLGGHVNSLDIGLSAALTCVLACFLIAQHPSMTPSARRAWMRGAWAAVAVAVLTKGLVGIVLPGLAVCVYMLFARDWRFLRRLRLVEGVVWLLVLTVPWFVLITKANPEFLWFFFIHEHWMRYTSSIHGRSGPVWYFLPEVVIGVLPWLGVWRGVGRELIGEAREQAPAVPGSQPKTPDGFKPKLFVAIWACAILVFFSASGSKLPGYILPMFPALAILVACALGQLRSDAWKAQLRIMLIVSAIGILTSPLVGRMGSDDGTHDAYRVYMVWVAAAFAVLFVGLVVAWRIRPQERDGLTRSIGVMAVSTFFALSVALIGQETQARINSNVDLVAPIEAVLTPEMPIYSVRLLDHTLPFYLRHTMIMVETADELEFGTQQEPSKWLPTVDLFLSRWSNGQHALALMSPDTYRELRVRHVPMVVIAQNARRVAVANFETIAR